MRRTKSRRGTTRALLLLATDLIMCLGSAFRKLSILKGSCCKNMDPESKSIFFLANVDMKVKILSYNLLSRGFES